MHVLYFHQHFTTPAGSTGTRSYEMAKALIASGHRVTIVCGSSGGGKTGLNSQPQNGIRTGNVEGIDIIEFCLPYSNADSFLRRSLTFAKFSLRSTLLALRYDYDLVFASSTPLTVGIPGIFARLLRRKPFVFEVRDLWPELPREMGVIKNPLVLKLMEVIEYCSYKSATALIALSPGIERGITQIEPAVGKVTIIPNGSDTELFSPKTKQGFQEIAADEFSAIFTGAHGIANGLDAVLDAAVELKSRGVAKIKLVFLGDGKLKPALMQRAKNEQLENCIFLEPLPKEELAKKLSSVDLGLMILDNVPAFYYGTSPNKFFDYIAAGIPVLTNYPGWIADLVQEHQCGLAVPPDDPKAFAEALIYLAQHPEERQKMGKAARELAQTQFDRKDLATSFVRFLEAANY